MSGDYKLRPATPDEAALILDSWARSFGAASSMSKSRDLAQWLWYRAHRAVIKEILGGAQVAVAEFSDVPGEVLGWACWERPSSKGPLQIHYCYVKPPYRRNGIGTDLLHLAFSEADNRGVRTTHRTRDGKRLMDSALASDVAATSEEDSGARRAQA